MKDKKQKKEINRLFDLEVDEVSLVDKPAIGESFIVTKSLKNNKGVNGMKVEKTISWKEKKLKTESKELDECGFCHIKEADASMGLLCSVCFDCAVKREEKGVFDACIEGTFSMEKYKEENPDDEAFKTTEVDADEKGNGKVEEKTSELGTENHSSNETNIYEERIIKLEEGLTDVSSMLAQSLELHGVAADALNQVMSLTFGALDLLMAGMDKEEKEQNELVTFLKNDLKLAHEDISKAGAKISSGRLAVLRDIAEKLTSLIESVAAQKKSELDAEKGSKEETSKSIENLKLEISDLKKSVLNSVEGVEGKLSEKFKSVDERIEGLENSGVGSSNIEDEEDSLIETQKSNSVFGNILGLDEIQKSASARIR